MGVTGTVLGCGDIALDKIKKNPCPLGPHLLVDSKK